MSGALLGESSDKLSAGNNLTTVFANVQDLEKSVINDFVKLTMF